MSLSTAPSAPPVSAAAGGFFAHVRAGACDLAVPVGDIVLAMPVPAGGLTPLPRRNGALAGLLQHDGGVVPVVALDRWLSLGAAGDPADARIVVLRAGPSLIGFLADALMGIHAIAATAIRPVHRDDDGDELVAAVAPATAERPLLCLLEVRRLMALAHAWCDDAGLRPGQARAATAQRRATGVRYALFAVGDAHWAIPATAIARLVTTPVPEMRWAGQLVCGICPMDKRKLPMVDLAHAAGAPATGHPWMAVVAQGPQAIGVVASRCERLVTLAADDIVLTPGDRLLAGTAIIEGLGTVSLLDVDKLFGAVPEATISLAPATRRPPGTASAPAAAAPDSQSDYLVFEADRHYATPVAGLIGVMALPAAAAAELAAGRRATVAWRGDTVGVVNLPSINGKQTMAEPRLAVVLEGEHKGRAGSAIAIRSLVDWVPGHAARHGSMRMNGIGDVNVITSQRAHHGASLVVVDLAQMTYLLN